MKMCQASIKQGTQIRGRQRYKKEGPKSRPKENTTNVGRPQGEDVQIKYSKPSTLTRSISDKERGETTERTLSLEEHSWNSFAWEVNSLH
jgi:hypothetical protein